MHQKYNSLTYPLRTLILRHEDEIGKVTATVDITVAPVVHLVVVDGLEELLRLHPLKVYIGLQDHFLIENLMIIDLPQFKMLFT